MEISIKLTVILVVSAILTSAQGISILEAKNLKAQKKVLGFLTFGDSSVDSGNNDFLLTPFKSNFAPYGINYFNHTPNGRFCDGRLAADFVVEYFDFGNHVPAYLDPDLKAKYITHEKYVATFASAGSGYDPLTALYGLVNPLSAQLELFKQYKQTMIGRLGSKKAQNTMDKVICLISAGTNDLTLSYIGNPFSIRRLQYTQDGYEDYLVTLMRQYIEEMHQQGCKRIAVAGVPPIGCMPFVRLMTFTAGNSCSDTYNEAAMSMNSKIQAELKSFRLARGFNETEKGCCGTGYIEIGTSCRGLPTCSNPKEYVFWDSVHPTQALYKIMSKSLLRSFPADFFL
ncbi:GDSL esterase/lipase-like protein [Drosera capensis]